MVRSRPPLYPTFPPYRGRTTYKRGRPDTTCGPAEIAAPVGAIPGTVFPYRCWLRICFRTPKINTVRLCCLTALRWRKFAVCRCWMWRRSLSSNARPQAIGTGPGASFTRTIRPASAFIPPRAVGAASPVGRRGMSSGS